MTDSSRQTRKAFGQKIPFGLKNGVLLDVSEVEQGLACDCVCPACHTPLQARKGKKTVHHFAHNPKTRPEDCHYAYETALHMMAKQILVEHALLILPELRLEESMKNPGGWEMQAQAYVAKKMAFTYDTVELEKQLGPYQPDVIVTDGKQQILIEIAVTHFVDPEKKQAIRKDKHMAVEIDLSKLDRFPDKQDLIDAVITTTSNKRWLSHPDAPSTKGKLRSKLMIRKHTEIRTYGNGLRDVLTNRHVSNLKERHDPKPLSKLPLPPRGKDYLDYDIDPRTGKKITRYIPDPPSPKKKTVGCKHCRHVFEVDVFHHPKICPLCLDDL